MTTKLIFVDLTSRGLCDKFLWAHRSLRNSQAALKRSKKRREDKRGSPDDQSWHTKTKPQTPQKTRKKPT